MRHILYVEDEPFLAKIVREGLEGKQFRVTHVGDGAKVVTTLERCEPDVCVLDVMLPNIDGFTLAREIRHRKPQLPILFVTAKEQTQDVVEGFKAGGNDYIRKPFSLEELVVRIENILTLTGMSSRTPERHTIQLGGFTFLPDRLELLWADRVRKLSHRENELLFFLASNLNSIIQRKDILLEIWGDDSFFNSRNLDVYITKIREYLRADDSLEIVTIKGVGYRFLIKA